MSKGNDVWIGQDYCIRLRSNIAYSSRLQGMPRTGHGYDESTKGET